MEHKDEPAFSSPLYFRQQSDQPHSPYSRQANKFFGSHTRSFTLLIMESVR
ncbi:hypothetical protein ABIE12_002951 [Serratia sp. 509]